MAETPETGVVAEIEPGLRRLLAPNPSPMTHWGTNSYIVGSRDVAVIDPGPDDPAHFEALRRAVAGARVKAVLVTHAHRDHSPLATRLARETGAPVCAYGPAEAGRSEVMTALADAGLAGGGEGVDRGFIPDRVLGDGERIEAADWTLTTLHTPGHFAGHLSFALGDLVLTGDHVMGWASTLISPPDGDLSAFMASCDRLDRHRARRFHPGHGGAVEDPSDRLQWLVAHRRGREAEILETLGDGPGSARTLAARIYTDIPEGLLPAATRNVLAHLIDLHGRKRVTARPALAEDAEFALA